MKASPPPAPPPRPLAGPPPDLAPPPCGYRPSVQTADPHGRLSASVIGCCFGITPDFALDPCANKDAPLDGRALLFSAGDPSLSAASTRSSCMSVVSSVVLCGCYDFPSSPFQLYPVFIDRVHLTWNTAHAQARRVRTERHPPVEGGRLRGSRVYRRLISNRMEKIGWVAGVIIAT